MLGIKKAEHTWGWAACGKHPAARDFLWIGQDSPLVKSFSQWVEKGYRALPLQSNAGKSPLSWRFWARWVQKGALVCGLIRDSSDSLGRLYPLMILGGGPLSEWEDRWDLLPDACEKTWTEIEYISAQKFEDFNMLRTNIENIQPPQLRWSDYLEKKEPAPGDEAMSDPLIKEDSSVERQVRLLSDKAEGIIRLDQNQFHNQSAAVRSLHVLFKFYNRAAPNAVFVGGTVDQSFLAIFRRPLSTDDFVKLWSIPAADMKGNESADVR